MVQNDPPEAARRRGRPRSFDEAEVLQKAQGVFWNLGYAAASLDDLAAATGLNRPSLYAAFGDKHALYIRALEHSSSTALAAIRAVLERDIPLREALGRLFQGAIDRYLAGERGPRGCFIVGTAVTQAVNDPEARELAARFVAEEDSLFLARFAAAADELAPGVDPAAAAVMASSALHSLAVRARTGADTDSLTAVARAAVDLLCKPA